MMVVNTYLFTTNTKPKPTFTMEKQLYSLVCAQAGQTLSSDYNPTKDSKIQLTSNARIFGNEFFRLKGGTHADFLKRKTFFDPHFNLGENTWSDVNIEYLLTVHFPGSPSDKQADNNWNQFKTNSAFAQDLL